MKALSVYKDWIVSWVILKLKGKPFHVKTAIDYILLAFKVSGHLPKRIRALEIFGMYGLYVTRHYQHLCEYIELWEIDEQYVKYARKFKSKNMTVIQGDSIAAARNCLFQKHFNFLVVDNPLVSPFGGKFFEHFDVLPDILHAAEDECLLLTNVILTSPEALYVRYGFVSEQHHEERRLWEAKRSQFYNTGDQIINPAKYVQLYTEKFESWGFNVQYTFFLPRNESVGFLGLALRRRKS